MKPHSPIIIKDNSIARYLRRIGFELKPNDGNKVTNSYKEYYKKFHLKK